MDNPEDDLPKLEQLWREYLDLTLNRQENTTERRRKILRGMMTAGLEQADGNDFDR